MAPAEAALMFERLTARAEQAARDRARAVRAELVERIAAAAPGGVMAQAVEDGVALTGRGLRRRAALDPAVRWLMAGLRR
jgi:hypothetical protein